MKLFNWKGVAVVLIVLMAVAGLCVLDLQCSGGPGPDSQIVRMKGEWNEGKKAMRQQESENLVRLARDLRVLACRYRENGERIAGFDEGFKPQWKEEFARRGISVVGPVLPELGRQVLTAYRECQGIVYSPRNNG